MTLGTELETVRDEVKRTVTMAEVVRMCGLSDPKRGKIRSIFNPAERTPSLHLYDYDWYDFSTGQGGDQIAFVQEARGVSYRQALEILGRGMPLAVRPRERFANDMPYEPPDFTARFQNLIESEDVDQWEELVQGKWPYLQLVDLFALGCKVTDTQGLWVPHWVPDLDGTHYVRGIKVRHLDGGKSAITGSVFTVGLYRPTPARRPTSHALVTEGESDAWVMAKMLDSRDVTVYGLPSGASTLKDRYLDELTGYSTVTVVFDDDEPGLDAANWFLENRPSVNVIEAPGGRVAEAAATGWNL
ncbi:hypothetical protein LCGC14_2669830 [marine sediment metagenome]|uniref:Zinc finger CHC2-type domain-containing protein n=1 Tax=marine sediment metagenome TaxID=412755 RepID=A0A0F9ABV4_9ZZZZ